MRKQEKEMEDRRLQRKVCSNGVATSISDMTQVAQSSWQIGTVGKQVPYWLWAVEGLG